MSGIYIHIPMCASRCAYCDFYSTTNFRDKAHEYVDALLKEYDERYNFLPEDEPVQTIYIGGGTPSQLPVNELSRLIQQMMERIKNTHIIDIQEITIEVNPEDATIPWAKSISTINSIVRSIASKDVLRVSIGIQSFNDKELQLIHRRHDSVTARGAASRVRRFGNVHNISIDLMYGLPTQTLQSWRNTVAQAIETGAEHISAYCLSVEKGTELEKQINARILTLPSEELCLDMERFLHYDLRNAGYHRYEISNYALHGRQSLHNRNYWNRTPYLGLGPGAHSYDGKKLRTWNEGNMTDYLNGVRTTRSETLSDADVFNEKIMLGLRTVSGINKNLLTEPDTDNLIPAAQQLVERGMIKVKENKIILTKEGLPLADQVIRELMITE